MKAKQLYYALVASLCIVLAGFVGVGFGANKVLGSQATKLSRLRAETSSAQAQQTAIMQDKGDITKYAQLNTIAASVVPQDKDQAQAVRQIVNLATDSGISSLTSITFPSSTLGTAGAGQAANPNFTQLTPVQGITGVYNLQITITEGGGSTVPYDSFLTFLGKLEQNRRTAQVASISVQPDPKAPDNVSFTLVIDEFIKP